MVINARERVPTSFDSCNIKNLIDNPKSCLLECDRSFYNSNPPMCGNNLREEGEECDCGFDEACILTGRRGCCDPNTCQFVNSAYNCDEGTCCDGCKYKRGNVCRQSTDDCDISDFCGGDNPYCPDNYRSNGLKCANNSPILPILIIAFHLHHSMRLETAQDLVAKRNMRPGLL
ncbi:hypothetical protein HZS_4304 [Henneguya salminicola]|nr:hypothetical protein HZS_4304 [Henneguya salminicola]